MYKHIHIQDFWLILATYYYIYYSVGASRNRRQKAEYIDTSQVIIPLSRYIILALTTDDIQPLTIQILRVPSRLKMPAGKAAHPRRHHYCDADAGCWQF
jgi:hypothetical protein